jgi:hypothetical protein
MTTTLNVYKKQITPEALKVGMKLFEQKALAEASGRSEPQQDAS